MTHQTETDCPTPETHNWGCGCPTDVAAAIASCPGHEVDGPSPCRCPCEGCKHNCAAHQPAPAAVSAAVAPPTQAADEIRDQLLHAIDHAYTTGVLGYTSPEDLLAAYDTSRTPATDRAAVSREAEAELYVLLRKAGEPRYEAQALIDRHRNEVLGRAELRRMADETATETPQPRRGDAFEAWLKAQRDRYDRHGESSEFWHEFDRALDQYRLHADLGAPLDGHVCEAKVVGDCECLEQPAAGARQDGAET